jgi:hydrogenase maturation factor
VENKKSKPLKGLIQPLKELVMTKWCGIEGTVRLAKEKETELRTHYPRFFIEGAQRMKDFLSIEEEARLGKEYGVSVTKEVLKDGIFGALWELGANADVGLTVDLKKIPIRQETVEICNFFDLNPYMLPSGGCLLLVTDYGNELVELLQKKKIPATVIGRITAGCDRLIINEEEKRYLEPPRTDELGKVFKERR